MKAKERWVHDIYASVDIFKNVQVFGGVTNIFGQRPEVGFNTWPVSSVGRIFFGGARVRFDP